MSRELTIAAYLAVLVLMLAATGLSHRERSSFAPLGEVLDQAMTERCIRVVLLVFWWWLGWHFLVGQTVDPPVVP